MTAIVSDASIRSGDPRIGGTRITVFDIHRRVIDNDEDPHVVAGEYGLSLADLFHALAYYYDHRDELAERERETGAARRTGERQTQELLESVENSNVETGEQAD